ncbi:MAG: hypothetical protein ABIS50_13305 [Luteolibacter sp.]|uniref:immunoglobulin domain-containing protein n=1 Tax=Luteolibacter sp. TaxID=1962973 RepID=UPI0032649CEA
MSRFPHILRKHQALATRFGSLLLLFQRMPLVQFLFPEARVLGTVRLGDIAGWTVATIVGLGTYDTVTGASAVTQVAPSPGAATVSAAKGSPLTFVFQSTGTEAAAGSWQVIGKLPVGLVHRNAVNNSVDVISGVPGQTGSFPITIKAWEKANQSGSSLTKNFTITVGSAIIIRQPASTSIPSGSSASLSVVGSGSGLTYQWFMGKSPSTKKPISKATKSIFKTPALTAKAFYWVRVTRGGISANSQTATVNITSVAAAD